MRATCDALSLLRMVMHLEHTLGRPNVARVFDLTKFIVPQVSRNVNTSYQAGCNSVSGRIETDEHQCEEPRSGGVLWSAIPQTPRDPRSRDLPRDHSGAGAISASGEIASLPTVARNDELPPI